MPIVERCWLRWARRASDLGGQMLGDVLDVVRLVRLPKEQRRGAVRRDPLVGEEVRITGGHDPVGHEKPGMPVVGVQAVALPWVMAEHDIGPKAPDPVCQLPAPGPAWAG